MIRFIVSDLDNTLLRRDKTISAYTINTFAKCRDKGILLAFATARPKRAVFNYLDILDHVQFDAMIFHNGGVVFEKGIPIANFGIAPTAVSSVLHKIEESCKTKISVEINDTLYANFDPSKIWSKINYTFTDFTDLPNYPAEKIIAEVSTPSDIKRIAAFLPQELYVELSDGRLGLIMNREATKLRAVQLLTERFGFSLAETAAFGDDYNDIELLRACGVGVSVSNAIEDVKSVSDYICGDCDEDGVARWIEEHVLV
jgi:Cof subfamily protein (haloacid dehalogenase superfamily)